MNVYYVGILVVSLSSCIMGKQMLPLSCNKFNDAIITIPAKFDGAQEFNQLLTDTIHQVQQHGSSLLWLRIPLRHAALIPCALDHNFIYHHVADNMVFMLKELQPGAKEMVSEWATHTAGFAGIVIDEHNNILVIKEKFYPELGYKLPSGGAHKEEHIWQAAVREIKEETGIDVEFVGIVGWREALDKKEIIDLCFCCVLRPISTHIKLQTTELTDACWMPYTEFKNIATGWSAEFLKIFENSEVRIKFQLGENSAFTTFYSDSY